MIAVIAQDLPGVWPEIQICDAIFQGPVMLSVAWGTYSTSGTSDAVSFTWIQCCYLLL